jgi:hypothetical protein
MRRILAVGVLVFLGFLPGKDGQQFTDWLTIENLGPEVNSIDTDSCVAISKNGMNLIFSSTRPGVGNRDLYMSKRESRNGLWGTPAPLTMINTIEWESCPALSLDEHHLYFTRPGGCGQEDIWVSPRQNRRNDSSGWEWEEPVNLGCEADGLVNSTGRDLMPTYFENEEGKVLMYFASNRPGSRGMDIYESEMRDDETFGPATPVTELNSPSADSGIAVRRDGLEVIFLSTRPYNGKVSSGSPDFWHATRSSTSDHWSEIAPIPSLGNPAWANGRISLSFDGSELYFSAWNWEGNSYDLYVAKREKVRGNQ